MKRKVVLILLNIALILSIGVIDYLTTSSIKIIVAYLIPIFISTYFINFKYGALFSACAVIIDGIIEYGEKSSVDSVLMINSITLLCVYMVVLYLVNSLRKNTSTIENNLEEKENILRDIHHRMKNQISSLLSIINLSDQIESKTKLSDLSGRLHTYLLLYENLCYDNKSQSRIHLRKYLDEIAGYIIQSQYGGTHQILYSMEGGDFFLENKIIVSIGLIVNELMTNSIKHAFEDEFTGSIKINIRNDGDTLIMDYYDSGSGFDYSPDEPGKKLGIIMITSLVKQLNGTIEYSKEEGSRFILTFHNMNIHDAS